MSSISAFGLLAMMAAMLVNPASSQNHESLYATEIAAVQAAANLYNPISLQEDREYIGAVFRRGEQFGFNVTAGAPGADAVQMRVPEMLMPDVVAFWHTHGGAAPSNRYFSAADTGLAKRFGRPFYLADDTGYLKVFNSGDPTLNPYVAMRLGLPRQSGYAIGSFVRDEFNRPVRVQLEAAMAGRSRASRGMDLFS